MFVRQRMTRNPVIVAPKALLSTAREKMTAGKFRRVPVMQEGVLVGMLTDRDLRQYVGVEERTRIEAAMTKTSLTVAPTLTIEEATKGRGKHQISGVPVRESGQLIGLLTPKDMLTAFLHLPGATAEKRPRVSRAAQAGATLTEAAYVLTQAGEAARRESRPSRNAASLSAGVALARPPPRQAWARTAIRWYSSSKRRRITWRLGARF
jgi:acetoin utilization protein AcuB